MARLIAPLARMMAGFIKNRPMRREPSATVCLLPPNQCREQFHRPLTSWPFHLKLLSSAVTLSSWQSSKLTYAGIRQKSRVHSHFLPTFVWSGTTVELKVKEDGLRTASAVMQCSPRCVEDFSSRFLG
eukprot:1154360-Pelagomonas_calceolata.AAC.1